MDNMRFDFARDDSKTGFRLHSFSLYNWGTYDKDIFAFDLGGDNALLTGDIGSGKSTVVDALTTLLVPTQKITYNKAAGSKAKERTLHSYVVGEYKTSQNEDHGQKQSIALRDHNSYTVLCANFYNEGYDEYFALAQFFYLSPSSHTINRFFVTSRRPLAINKDFMAFASVKALKKELRTKPHTQVHETFKEYEQTFKRAMGIKSAQAMNLFYQTVSMKAIGDLTSFIRQHMLEKADIDAKINDLIVHFSELSSAHDLVLEAKREIELLEPICSDGRRYEQLEKDRSTNEMMEKLQEPFLAMHKIRLLQNKIDHYVLELEKNATKRKTLEQRREELSEKITDLNVQIRQNGGDRLAQIERELKTLQEQLEQKKQMNKTYNEGVKQLKLPVASNEHRFLLNRNELENKEQSIRQERQRLDNDKQLCFTFVQKYDDRIKENELEIIYLQNNPSNIPKHISKIRDDMAQHLDMDASKLPFAGELLHCDDKSWQGAIERVLRGFALTLLVDEQYYDAVSEYVENTNLKGKLVYFRIDPAMQYKPSATQAGTLPAKITIKADSLFYDYLHQNLHERFAYTLCENLSEFKKVKKGLSKNGQIKSSLSRHEKDDRFAIDDAKNFVLGWDNVEKLRALQDEKKQLEAKKVHESEKMQELAHKLQKLEDDRDRVRDLLQVSVFDQINWYDTAQKMQALNDEKTQLEKSRDVLQTLREELAKEQKAAKTVDKDLNDTIENMGNLKSKKSQKSEDLSESKVLYEQNKEDLSRFLQVYEDLISDFETLNLNTLKTAKTVIARAIAKEKESINNKLKRLQEKLTTQMTRYLSEFAQRTQEMDNSTQSLREYENRLRLLKTDNLPKFEKKFFHKFQEGTIHNVMMLKEFLHNECRLIEEKIAVINKSLCGIEYDSGTYIELIAERIYDSEIKEFELDLKNALSGAVEGDERFSESKFLEIKKIIARLRGREGYSDDDGRWRQKVTDVRNWYGFSAIERYISDHSQKEYYTDSGGKSGGQKEKLAYTVLASALAYQFGLEKDKIQSRSFRFAVIDEAFGRGSDESTRYALELFDKLNLQLLVITPKQKINVIEPYVSSIHFVYNNEGMDSQAVSLGIEEYRKRKADVL